MKKLKLTINGEVKTFDLPENVEYKCEVEESYVPKKGDCVMIESKEDNGLYWCKLIDITNEAVAFRILVDSNLRIHKNRFLLINENIIYTKINPEELYVKYLEAGYYWDYQSDTIKPIKWVPKDGDKVWYLSIQLVPARFLFNEDDYFNKTLLEKGLLFPTEDECQKFADHCLKYFEK